MSVFLAILWKDLVTEWRSRDRIAAMLLFSLLVVVIFHFSLPGGATRATQATAPGLLWIAYVFAALLGLNRSFSLELENDALAGIALSPRRSRLDLPRQGRLELADPRRGAGDHRRRLRAGLRCRLQGRSRSALAGVVALGSLGICSVGTLFAAVAVRTRFREVMLPLLLLPLLVPVLLGAVRATAGAARDGRARLRAACSCCS